MPRVSQFWVYEMQEETNNKKEKNRFIVFTPKEEKLYELLTKYDEAGQLPKMLEGVVKVLDDTGNPMRFSQAANTIRGIADTLLNYNDNKISKSKPNIDEYDFSDLKNSFETILKSLLDKIADLEDKEETKQQANRKYVQLNNLLLYGARTRKHQLLDLLGSTNDLRILPKALQENAEKLAETYHYFSQVLHRYKEEEPEFSKYWLFFQDFLILVTSGFFDLAKEIDPFLEEETIFNEGLK